MVRVILVLLLTLSVSFAVTHNPSVPDTFFVSTSGNNRDGFLAGRNAGAFLTLRGLGTGTATIANSSSAAERGITWHSSTASTDTMNRFFWYSEALGSGGSFRGQLTANHRADSLFWSVKYEGEIDSGYAADSVYVIPSLKQNSNVGQVIAGHYNDPYTGATDGYDTTKYSAFKRNAGTNRATVRLNNTVRDSVFSWIFNSSDGLLALKIAMVGASDFRIDSLDGSSNAPSTSNTMEALNIYFSESSNIADRPYVLYYWTDTTPATRNYGWQEWGFGWNFWSNCLEILRRQDW